MKENVAFGIDLSAQQTVIVRALRSGRRLRLETVTAIPANALTAAGLATHESFARRIVAPLASVDKARRVLPSLLDVQLPFPLEKCVYDFPEVTTNGSQCEALAAAARVEDVTSALQRLKAAGYDPLVLDHEALALWTQSLEESPPVGQALRAIVYAGRDRSAVVLGRGTKFLAAQGGRQAIPDAPRLQQFLRAQLGEEADTPFAWAVVGPGSEHCSASSLNRPDGTPVLKYKEPAAFLARALATRALGMSPLGCNLRSGALEHPQMESRRSSEASRAVRMCLAAGIALCLLNFGWSFYLRHRDAAAQGALTQVAQELTGMARVPKGQEVMMTQRAVDEKSSRLIPFADYFKPSLTAQLAPLIASANEGDIWIHGLTYQNGSIELAGQAPTAEAAAALVPLLAAAGWTPNVQSGEAGADARVRFTLKGTR